MTQTPADSLTSSFEQVRSDRALLDEIIEKQSLGVDFQPVVDIKTKTVVGHKALARGPAGTPIASPSGLLSSAKASGHLDRLDWMFRCAAFEQFAAAESARGLLLFVKFEPETFGTPCPPRLAGAFGLAKRQISVVVDIAERAFDDVEQLRRGIAEFRGYGWQIALEDASARPGIRSVVQAIEPDYVKVDVSQPGRAQSPGATWLAAYATEHGATLMADGVDSQEALEAAVALEVTTGRGRFLGHATQSLS